MEPAAEQALPEPGTLGALRPPLVNLGLFALTFASALLAGSMFRDSQLPQPLEADALFHFGGMVISAETLWQGLGFSASLLFIMLSHEMGHFLLARKHAVDASWPFFIPAPVLSLIGTLGAVIRLRSIPRTRRALLDIGAAGPIAGFVATIPVLLIGLKLSTVVNADPPSTAWSLWDSLISRVNGHGWTHSNAFQFNLPLGMDLAQRLIWGTLPEGKALVLHPVAIAGWFGFLLTALNLLPMGQLDGGHVLFGAAPRLHRPVGRAFALLLVGLGIFTAFPGWLLWGFVMGLGFSRHPALAEAEATLDAPRRWLVFVSLVLFVLSFVPVPLSLLST